MKYKGFWIVFSVYVVLMLGDFASTLYLGERIIRALETNILYALTGTLLAPFALNVGVCWFFHKWYFKHGDINRFIIIISMVGIIFVRVFVIQSNLAFVDNPPTEEQLIYNEQLPVVEKFEKYSETIVPLYFSPVFFALIVFLLWKWDHKTELKQ